MEECAKCGKHGDSSEIRLCTRCKTIRYCSHECQERHWLRHRVTCRAAGTETAATEQANSLHGDTDRGQTATAGATGGQTTVEADSVSGDSVPLMTCKKCRQRGHDMKKCARCQEVTYCSRDCQRGDWKVHKVTCRAVPTVTSTGGLRHTEEKDQGTLPTGDRAELSRPQHDPNPWARLFSTLYTDPWQQAKSRAMLAFPGNRVSDSLDDLDITEVGISVPTMPFMPWMPFMSMPFMPMPLVHMPFVPNPMPVMHGVSHVVLVVKLIASSSLPFIRGWLVEDSKGGRTHVFFGIPESSYPDFRFEDLRQGRFLCVKHGNVAVSPLNKFMLVEDASKVRIFKE